MTTIPLSQPDITQREIDAVVEVLQGGVLSIGPKLEEFENAVATRVGRRHAVGMSSGTSGLHCAMIAAKIGPGDEVLTSPFSFVASSNAALFVDAVPKFVDIHPLTLNLDPARLEAAITPHTKAVIAVEAFGHPGGMLEIERICRRHEIPLIEDSCEGLGGTVGIPGGGGRPIGSFGRASVFGFYPNKQITTGEGGMVVTDDDTFADLCRSLRNQGRGPMHSTGSGVSTGSWLAHQRLGYNYRLSEIAAAMGVVQMQRLDELLKQRHRVATLYMQRLMTNRFLILPTIDQNVSMSWFVFVVRLNDLFEVGERDEVIRRLRAEGIGCSNYFPPIHLQPFYRERFGTKPGDFPITEHVADRTLALPFFGRMTQEQIHHVCQTLEDVLERVLLERGR